MRVTPIQNINKNVFKNNQLAVTNNPEYKLFMQELNKWTESELDRIQQKFVSGSLEKENAIEFLFLKRDGIIRKKEAELYKKITAHKNWLKRFFS